jgi:hypothetical protein
MSRLLIVIGSIVVLVSCSSPQYPVAVFSGSFRAAIVVDIGEYGSIDEILSSNSGSAGHLSEQDIAIRTRALAARELQKYLNRMVGSASTVPIITATQEISATPLFVGRFPRNPQFHRYEKQFNRRWKKTKSKNPQGFRIDTFSNENSGCIVISGRTSIGTLYGVYELLDRLGVRWYAPGEGGEHTQFRQEIILKPTSYYAEPRFDIRGFWMNPDYFPREGDAAAGHILEFIEWMGRNRLNLFPVIDEFVDDLKLRGIEQFAQAQDPFAEFMHPDSIYPYSIAQSPTPLGFPPDPYKRNAYFKGDVDKDGKISYAEAHPEWFGARDTSGENVPADSIKYCLSQIDFLDELYRSLSGALTSGKWRNATVFVFGPLSPKMLCDCSDCRDIGNYLEKVLFLEHELQSRLNNSAKNGAAFGDIRVWAQVPAEQLIMPRKNKVGTSAKDRSVIVVLPRTRCLNHALSDKNCTEVNQGIYEHVEDWFQKKNPYKGETYIGEYYNDVHHRDLPLVFTHIIDADLIRYDQLGADGVYYAYPRIADLGVQSLLNYQFAKQSWDAVFDPHQVCDEFFQNYYANAGKLMTLYYDKIEEAFANIQAWRGELVDKVAGEIKNGLSQPVFPLDRYHDHFQIEAESEGANHGTSWVNTLQDIEDAGYILSETMTLNLPDHVEQQLLVDEHQLRYAELTVRLYDHFIRLLTLGEDEPEMREEAALRLRLVANQLAAFEIASPALGVTNGLQASGIQEAIQFLLDRNRQQKVDEFKNR